ncbi:MAG TPA: hypothetical protein VMI75_30870, partial [Polyangiaceae bacterium]|nr:hypothetical protein [Polyangiaceae bacterium]
MHSIAHRSAPLALAALLAAAVLLHAREASPGALAPDAAGAPSATPPAKGPTLAVEDTMHTSVPEVLVSAPRVTLAEILDRVARGEAHRDSLIQDVSFLNTLRVVGHADDGRTPMLLQEDVDQVWQRRPKQSRTVRLKHWELHPPRHKGDENGDVQIELSAGMGEDIVNFAFQPSARREYRYRIESRELLGDHLVYRIAFEPISPLALDQPGGEVWVDTRDFVIVRQEVTFRHSPVPLFLRGIRRMVVEREKIGDLWM